MQILGEFGQKIDIFLKNVHPKFMNFRKWFTYRHISLNEFLAVILNILISISIRAYKYRVTRSGSKKLQQPIKTVKIRSLDQSNALAQCAKKAKVPEKNAVKNGQWSINPHSLGSSKMGILKSWIHIRPRKVHLLFFN